MSRFMVLGSEGLRRESLGAKLEKKWFEERNQGREGLKSEVREEKVKKRS